MLVGEDPLAHANSGDIVVRQAFGEVILGVVVGIDKPRRQHAFGCIDCLRAAV